MTTPPSELQFEIDDARRGAGVVGRDRLEAEAAIERLSRVHVRQGVEPHGPRARSPGLFDQNLNQPPPQALALCAGAYIEALHLAQIHADRLQGDAAYRLAVRAPRQVQGAARRGIDAGQFSTLPVHALETAVGA